MTEGQRESIYLVYVNVCNALTYADVMMKDNVSKPVKDSMRVIRDRLRWIKTNMDLKVGTDNSMDVDILRFDALVRLVASMPEQYAERLENHIIQFLDELDEELKSGGVPTP